MARAFLLVVLSVIVPVSVAGCGGSTTGDYGGRHPDYGAALAGTPKPLSPLYRQANEVLPGGTGAFQRRLRTLRGYPVVVNKWASWCQPCREEFPLLQRAAARYGKRVAFVGVDSEDSDDAARTFLDEFPVPYPSYSDPDQKIAALIKATLGFPATAIYGSDGDLVYVKQGQYASLAELEADIRRYGVGEHVGVG